MKEAPCTLPDSRLRLLDDRPVVAKGSYVLYWMIAARRTRHNFALERALEWSRALGRSLLVLEPLRVGYRWAADRHHVFVLEGMRDQARRFEAAGIRYLPYIEPSPGAGQGLLRALAERAAVVVTDDAWGFFYPRMLAAAGRSIGCRLEAVDGNGLVPVCAAGREFSTAHAFRRYLQKVLPEHLAHCPAPDPLRRYAGGKARLPAQIQRRWPMTGLRALEDPRRLAASLPIDHTPGPVTLVGGERAGARRLDAFMAEGLARYAAERNHPDEDGGSGLSPYLHYGHIGAHQVLHALARREDWSPADLGPPCGGSREGYWGTSPAAEAFLDEVVTWRELGHNLCAQRDDYDRFESLPDWARTTMAEHAGDPRPTLYTHEQLETAQTHDPLWNAAQRQLQREGRIHNYLRMLWGKKIYQWSKSGPEALERMIELNNRWSLDGRDPNSYSGVTWVLGRFDRAWGPVRPIFGKLRYMTSDSTRRKLRVRRYLERYGQAEA